MEESYTQAAIERQNAIHELWLSERIYVKGLVVATSLYHDDLIDDPSIKQDEQRFDFVEKAFSGVQKLRELHESFLWTLENRIKTQGPCVVDVSDIIRNWIPRAVECYTQYAEHFPLNHFLIQREASRNPQFKQTFDSDIATMNWLKYLASPSTRIQDYTPLLGTILENTSEDTTERANIKSALDDSKSLLEQFHKSEAQGHAKVRVREVQEALVFPPSMGQIDLHLEDENRRIIHEGSLEGLGTEASNVSSATYAILFDNYLILAKQAPFSSLPDTERYDVLIPVSNCS
jgi:hypothetical protein